MTRKRIISLMLNTGPFQDFVDTLTNLGKAKASSYVCVANVHMLIEAYNDKEFADVVNNADIVTPDGKPLCHALEHFYGVHQDRVAGMDLMPILLNKAMQENISVFFYGGTSEMLEHVAKFLHTNYSNLSIAGMYSPPFRELTYKEENEIIQKINQSGAGFVFVCLGCPKQEKWMGKMKNKINACMIGIGGALPVMVGLLKRSPKWMQNANLEWLYRLGQEPNRLFKRYLTTNTKFCGLMMKEVIRKRNKRLSTIQDDSI